MSDQYTADDIQVLTDIQHIRKRMNMYIGDAINPSPLFNEILDNSIDELQNEFSSKIQVFINTESNTYIVRDFGRGIPHNKKVLDTGEEKEVLEILLTKSNSGGKFDHNAYKRSSGLHGLGITVTNALSSSMKVISYRDNEAVEINCKDGEVLDLKYYEQDDNPTGTYAEFTPDPQFFESEVIPESYIINRCNILRAFGYNIEYYKDNVLQDLKVSDIYDLLPQLETNEYCKNTIKFTSSTDEDVIVALRYNSGTKYSVVGYTNMLYNAFGGTHTRMIWKAICDAWSEFYNEVNTPLKYDDCTLGLDVLVAVFIGEISFSSQTKEKLTVANKNLEELMEGFKQEFIKYLKDNPELRKGLLKRFEEYRIAQNKLLNQKEIMNLVVVNNDKTGKSIRRRAVVPGLFECTSSSREGTELFIVEGNSAASPCARARDRRTQAVLPLRGKIKNVAYMSTKEALGYETVRNIINAIGASVGEDSDPELSRYEKIIIMTDGDADGCFTGDTKIKGVDGKTHTFKELVDNDINELWVYSKTPDGRVVPAIATNPRITKYVSELVELEFSNGFKVRCTKDHPILTLSGEYKSACDLTPDDEISSIYFSYNPNNQCDEYWDPVTEEFKSIIYEYMVDDSERVISYNGQQVAKGKIAKVINRVLAKGRKIVTRKAFEKARRNYYDPHYDTIFRYFSDIKEATEYAKKYNHRIVSNKIITLDEEVPVYDLTVDTYNNFLVCTADNGSEGIIVHNSHIIALILSALVNLLPNLVRAGMVYVVKAPLYSYWYNGEKHYALDMDEIPKDHTGEIIRYKGLGKMEDEELGESCLDPNNRVVYQVEYPEDIDKFNEIVGTSGGRSKLLEDLNVLTYINYDGGVDYES